MVTISKSFDFDAAHWLPRVAEDHKCHRMHGHTYRVEIICAGETGDSGMVLDYAELAFAWAPIHELLDHRVLNDVAGLLNPTTEIVAVFILKRLLGDENQRVRDTVIAVRVYESSTTWCEAHRQDLVRR